MLTTQLHVLEFSRTLLIHWPSPFRPLVPVFRPLSLSLILHLALPSSAPSSSTASSSYAVPHEVRQAATDLLASLHVTNGKAQSPAAWSADMKEALGGLAMAMHGIAADAWLEGT